MNFIDDEDLVPVARGRDRYRIDDHVAHILDAGIRSRVDLKHIHRIRFRDLNARWTLVTGSCGQTGRAVERLCQYARSGGLADAARTGEQVGVMNAIVLERVPERAADRILPDHLLEGLGPELARDDVRVLH